METSLCVFTFRNKLTLEETPIVFTLAKTLDNAEMKVRKYFPKYLFDKVKCMQINNKRFVGILSYDNIELTNFMYGDN